MSLAQNELCAVQVEYDETWISPALETERSVAIADLLMENRFELIGRDHGPYRLTMSTKGSRLELHVATSDDTQIVSHILSFTPFRRVIRDYVAICEALARVAASGDHYKSEAVDMSRRAIHNEGSDLLMERLSRWIKIDQETSRRLFTLIAAPYISSAVR